VSRAAGVEIHKLIHQLALHNVRPDVYRRGQLDDFFTDYSKMQEYLNVESGSIVPSE
jgi:hypothetical protein